MKEVDIPEKCRKILLEKYEIIKIAEENFKSYLLGVSNVLGLESFDIDFKNMKFILKDINKND